MNVLTCLQPRFFHAKYSKTYRSVRHRWKRYFLQPVLSILHIKGTIKNFHLDHARVWSSCESRKRMYKDRSQRAKRAVVTRSNTTVNRLPSVCILYWERSFSCLQKEIGRPAMCKEDNLTEFLSMNREKERETERVPFTHVLRWEKLRLFGRHQQGAA